MVRASGSTSASPAQQSYKREQVAAALGLFDDAGRTRLRRTVTLPATGFRTTVHAAVTNGRAGFRRYRSHRVVPVESCLVAHPLLDELIVQGSYGDASEVLFRCGARTGERLAIPTPFGTAIDVPADVRRDHIHELAAGHRWRISARSFFQTRPDGVDALADAVIAAADEMEPGGRALDLYSGVGVFAGVLAARGWSVTAVESDRSAVDDAGRTSAPWTCRRCGPTSLAGDRRRPSWWWLTRVGPGWTRPGWTPSWRPAPGGWS